MKKYDKEERALEDKIKREWEEYKNRTSQCLHDTCPECHGRGVKHNGSKCFHLISCPCSKCSGYTLGSV